MAITYEHKPIDWDNEGIEPTQDLIEQGWKPGYKPPAEYFNAILNRTALAITEIQSKTADLSVDFEAFTIDSGITDGTCTYAADTGYTVTADSAVQSADYFCIRFKAPNDYVSGAKFTIGTTAYTVVNAGFKENDVVMLNFDRAQQKCFAIGGGAIDADNKVEYVSEGVMAPIVLRQSVGLDVDISNFDTTSEGISANHPTPEMKSSILTGWNNHITIDESSNPRIFSTILSGHDCTVKNTIWGSIISGNYNEVSDAYDSLISGSDNTVTGLNKGVVVGEHCTVDTSVVSGSGVKSCYQSAAFGYYTTSKAFNFVLGKYNKTPTAASTTATTGDLFIVGNGLSSSKTNAFRVAADGGVYGTKAYTASGADYAELFEFADGNENDEDRRGLFVTLDGDKIRLANADDDYILGVVSATPSVVADAQTDDWHKKWKTDIFGERLLDENGAWILNDDFKEEENESYVSRLDRKEWAAVGLVGKLIVVDDGTCEVNSYCKPKNGGVATKAETGYRVMKRLDDTHIQILFR